MVLMKNYVPKSSITPEEKKDLVEVAEGESDKKAIPAVTRLMKDKEKREEEKHSFEINRLDQLRRFGKEDYTRFLADLMKDRLKKVDWDWGWSYQVEADNKGVIMELYFGRRVFRAAFKATGEAELDLNAIIEFGERAENTVDKWKIKKN